MQWIDTLNELWLRMGGTTNERLAALSVHIEERAADAEESIRDYIGQMMAEMVHRVGKDVVRAAMSDPGTMAYGLYELARHYEGKDN